MFNIDVAVFSRNRLPHLRLCTEWLAESKPASNCTANLICYDDSSDFEETIAYQLQAFDAVMRVPRDSRATSPEQRIGCARRFAVDQFLRHSKADFLLLLDSDIIVTKETIGEAVSDYQEADEWVDLGGMTLHALSHICGTLSAEKKKFGYVSLTGDAHMLFRRDHLSAVGNHYGPEEKAFADTQIRAILDSHRKYITRIDPFYPVQHIGFGDGASTIYEDGSFIPSWVSRPYWTNFEPRRILQVRNFDVLYYVDCVSRVGGKYAPDAYVKAKGINP